MKRAVFALLVGLLVGSGINVVWVDAQGPLTSAMNLRVRTDSNGYLLIAPATYTASDGPLTAFGNIRLRTDSNGYLLTAMGATGGSMQLADGTVAAPSLAFASHSGTGAYLSAANVFALATNGGFQMDLGGGAAALRSDALLGWYSGTTANGTMDVILARDAANTLALRNTASSQVFNIYNTTDGTNKEYLSIGWSANQVLLHTIAAGTGTSRDLAVGTNGAGDLYLRRAGVNTWKIAATGGHLTGTIPGAGLGYSAGAGGAITQITSRTTGVTLSTVTGDITLVSAAGSATAASFTVTNTAVAVTDNIIINQKSGTDLYNILITNVGAGSFKVTFFTTGGTTTEQPMFHFSVIKGVNS